MMIFFVRLHNPFILFVHKKCQQCHVLTKILRMTHKLKLRE